MAAGRRRRLLAAGRRGPGARSVTGDRDGPRTAGGARPRRRRRLPGRVAAVTVTVTSSPSLGRPGPGDSRRSVADSVETTVTEICTNVTWPGTAPDAASLTVAAAAAAGDSRGLDQLRLCQWPGTRRTMFCHSP